MPKQKPLSPREREAARKVAKGLASAIQRILGDEAALRAALRPLAAIRRADLLEVQSIVNRVKNAKTLSPKRPAAKAWAVIGDMTPREALAISKYLPSPFGQGGRPKGSGPVARDRALLQEWKARVAAGEKKRPAMRALLRARGVPEELIKNRTEYVLKKLRKGKN